jgi:hypothetical protein
MMFDAAVSIFNFPPFIYFQIAMQCSRRLVKYPKEFSHALH